jgi:hypothetical protein
MEPEVETVATVVTDQANGRGATRSSQSRSPRTTIGCQVCEDNQTRSASNFLLFVPVFGASTAFGRAQRPQEVRCVFGVDRF